MACSSPLRLPLLAATVLAALALPTLPQRAAAHALESSLERVSQLSGSLDGLYQLESRFGNGEPADAAVVRLIPPGGEPIVVGRTDGQGRLRFSLPRQARSDWELQIDGGPSHRDYLELPTVSGQPAARISDPRRDAIGLASALGGTLLGLCGLGLARRHRQG